MTKEEKLSRAEIKKQNESVPRPAMGNVTLDWLSFSWCPELPEDYPYSFHFFKQVFPEFEDVPDWISADHTWSHYERGFRLSRDISIHYDTEDSTQHKGVCVQIPAHALQYVFSLFRCRSVPDFLKLLKKRGATVTRIDIAFDDYDRTFLPSDLYYYCSRGEVDSRFTSTSYSIIGTSSFYAGKRTSRKYLRVYDKYIESDGLYNCIRWEFENKGKFASFVADTILENGTVTFEFLLSKYLRLIVRDNANISRCSTLLEFDNFIQKSRVSRIDEYGNIHYEKIDIALPPKDYKDFISDYFKYFYKCIAPKLSVMFYFDSVAVIHMLESAFYNLPHERMGKLMRDISLQSYLSDIVSPWTDTDSTEPDASRYDSITLAVNQANDFIEKDLRQLAFPFADPLTHNNGESLFSEYV